MTDNAMNQRRVLEASIEHWSAEAKRLAEAGDEARALDFYRKAADELPGAPWLQQRTAELSRRLKRNDLAIIYFRRAATAFQLADLTKRAVAPLRTAWALALQGLPASSKALVDLAVELMQTHRRLGLAADAQVIMERTNAALRTLGFSELPARTAAQELGGSPGAAPARAAQSQPSSSSPPANPRAALARLGSAVRASELAPRSIKSPRSGLTRPIGHQNQ